MLYCTIPIFLGYTLLNGPFVRAAAVFLPTTILADLLDLPICSVDHDLSLLFHLTPTPHVNMISTYTNVFASAVNVTVTLGWRYASQLFVRPCAFPIRVALVLSSEKASFLLIH